MKKENKTINSKLNEEIRPYLGIYDCEDIPISNFLKDNQKIEDRQKEAVDIIEELLRFHNKQDLSIFIKMLSKIEPGIKEAQARIRDHIKHSLLCFLLGIYINEKILLNIQGGYQDSDMYVNPFQWKIACLLHDIGYPFEISQSILNSYKTEFNKIISRTNDDTICIDYKINILGLNNIYNISDDSGTYDSLDLIQECLTNWNLNLDAHALYNNMFNGGGLCHGIISSLVAIKIINSLYHRNTDWPRQDFKDYIIPACTAIFIHNLKEDRLEGCKIDYQKTPIAFLLKLSDTLQEWDRPKKDLENGLKAQRFDIDIQDNIILFSIRENTPYYKKAKEDIIEAIETTLQHCIIEQDCNQFKITIQR